MENNQHANLFVFSNSNKAGMNTTNREVQDRIIYESSKNSEYYKRQLYHDERNNEKVKIMQRQISSLSSLQLDSLRSNTLIKLTHLEKVRNFSRICCVLDMDMFYAAVELRDQPHLKDKPIAVGGMSMISTTNYVARKYGVRSAMPGFIGKKLCPELIFIPCNFQKYQEVSDQVRNIIAEYDSNYKPYGLDEVYFDLTAITHQRRQSHGSDEEMKSYYNDINDLRFIADG
jgi:DNA polymerase kappa